MLAQLHERADELGGRFRAMNTTGKMAKMAPPRAAGTAAGAAKP